MLKIKKYLSFENIILSWFSLCLATVGSLYVYTSIESKKPIYGTFGVIEIFSAGVAIYFLLKKDTTSDNKDSN